MNSNVRSRYYAKLGFLHQSPPSTSRPRQERESVRRTPSRPARSPPCLRHKRSVLHTTPARDQRVSFHPEVRLYRIKHHQDYPDEEWSNMWVDADTLDYEKDRNTFEFQADRADWRNATEEEDFDKAPDGSLIHPATSLAYRHHREQNGPAAPLAVDFRALLERIPSRRWSPRPVKQRKTFWLFDLAMDSVQKGKNAIGNRRQQNSSLGSQVASRMHPKRQSDRGWP